LRNDDEFLSGAGDDFLDDCEVVMHFFMARCAQRKFGFDCEVSEVRLDDSLIAKSVMIYFIEQCAQRVFQTECGYDCEVR